MKNKKPAPFFFINFKQKSKSRVYNISIIVYCHWHKPLIFVNMLSKYYTLKYENYVNIKAWFFAILFSLTKYVIWICPSNGDVVSMKKGCITRKPLLSIKIQLKTRDKEFKYSKEWRCRITWHCNKKYPKLFAQSSKWTAFFVVSDLIIVFFSYCVYV